MSFRNDFTRRLLVMGAVLLPLAGCNDGFDNDGPEEQAPVVTPEGSPGGRASVRLAVTDAPADDVARVQVTVRGLVLTPGSGEPVRIGFPEPVVIPNLLALQGGSTSDLVRIDRLPAGDYQSIALELVSGGADSFVMVETGGRHDLFVAGQGVVPGTGHWLLLSRPFTLSPAPNDLVLDIDLRRSLSRPGDYFTLRPALRLVDRDSAGSVRGAVDGSLIAGFGCTSDLAQDEGNAVYLYEGENAATGDIQLGPDGRPSSGANPLTVAEVRQNTSSGQYEFLIPFVPPGAYTLAFTCHSRQDFPDRGDFIPFAARANVRVNAGQAARQSLTASGGGSGDGGDAPGEDPEPVPDPGSPGNGNGEGDELEEEAEGEEGEENDGDDEDDENLLS